MTFAERVEQLRTEFSTTLVDPVKTKSNNRLVELMVDMAAALDTLEAQASDFESRIAELENPT